MGGAVLIVLAPRLPPPPPPHAPSHVLFVLHPCSWGACTRLLATPTLGPAGASPECPSGPAAAPHHTLCLCLTCRPLGLCPRGPGSLGRGDPTLTLSVPLSTARATLEILIPDFVKQTSEEKPKDSEELEVRVVSPPWCQAVLGFNRPGARCSVSCISSKRRPACLCKQRKCSCQRFLSLCLAEGREKLRVNVSEGSHTPLTADPKWSEPLRQRLQNLDCSLC